MTFFYNLNNKLNAIRDLPSVTHGQLNERDMSRAAKGYEKYGKQGMEALAKAGRDGKALDPVRKKYDKYDESVEEGLGDMARKVGGAVKKVAGKALDTLGHGSDADMIRDLQKKMGMPQTGMKPGDEPNPKQIKEKMSPAKAKSFAALAEPKDKITFADKIAGAKKEVDEMLGDVAAEAMKSALGGGRGRSAEMGEASDDNAFTAHKRPRVEKPAVGTVTHGRKHDVEEIPGGRRVTRRVDPSGISVGADDEASQSGEKRGRGRPKKAGGPAQERVTANSRKADRTRFQSKKVKEGGEMKQTFAILDDTLIDQISAMNGAEVDPDAGSVETWDENTARQLAAFAKANPQRLKQTQSMNTAGMKPMARAVGGTASGPEYNLKEEGDLKTAMKLLKKAGYKITKAGGQEELDEKAVSKKQQKFMGMVHAAQKGEKAPSKEVAKVAKTMKKSDAEDFAATKHKGLPEKKKSDSKKEKTEETADSTPSKGGMKFGGGIYDSMNRELENMIAESMARLDESMSINMSMNNDQHGGPSKSLTVTATDDDAMKLSQLLKSAGLGGGDNEGYSGDGYKPACGDQQMDEVSMNQPDYPTETETSADPFQYSGGLNKPKATGQTTVPVIASQDDRQGMAEGAGPDDIAVIERLMDEAFADGNNALGNALQDALQKIQGEQDAIDRMMEMAGISAPGGASAGDYIDYVSASGEQPPEDLIMQNGVEYDPDTNVISVRNATSLANTHRAIAAAGWKKQAAGARPNPAAAGQAMQAGDTAYQLGEQDAIDRMMEMAGQSASGMGAQVGDYIDYVSPKGEQPPEDLIMQNGVEYDPDTNVISVRNATSLANTHRAIAAAGWKKQAAGARPNPTAAGQAQMVGDVPYQLGEEDELSRIREMAGIKEAKKPDANKDGIPDYAQDGKGSKDLGKAKDKEKKVDEGILASTANLWKTYKGQYGV